MFVLLKNIVLVLTGTSALPTVLFFGAITFFQVVARDVSLPNIVLCFRQKQK